MDHLLKDIEITERGRWETCLKSGFRTFQHRENLWSPCIPDFQDREHAMRAYTYMYRYQGSRQPGPK